MMDALKYTEQFPFSNSVNYMNLHSYQVHKENKLQAKIEAKQAAQEILTLIDKLKSNNQKTNE